MCGVYHSAVYVWGVSQCSIVWGVSQCSICVGCITVQYMCGVYHSAVYVWGVYHGTVCVFTHMISKVHTPKDIAACCSMSNSKS